MCKVSTPKGDRKQGLKPESQIAWCSVEEIRDPLLQQGAKTEPTQKKKKRKNQFLKDIFISTPAFTSHKNLKSSHPSNHGKYLQSTDY